MNKKKQTNEMEEKLTSIVNEPAAEYHTKSGTNNYFDEERLYTHEEVFKEFAKRLNTHIGTNIPLY